MTIFLPPTSIVSGTRFAACIEPDVNVKSPHDLEDLNRRVPNVCETSSLSGAKRCAKAPLHYCVIKNNAKVWMLE